MAVGRCPQCNGKLEIPKKQFGKRISCAHCQHAFIASSEESTSAVPSSGLVNALSSLPLPHSVAGEPPAVQDVPYADSANAPVSTDSPASAAAENVAAVPKQTPPPQTTARHAALSQPSMRELPVPEQLVRKQEEPQRASAANPATRLSSAPDGKQSTAAPKRAVKSSSTGTARIKRQQTPARNETETSLPTLSLKEQKPRKQIDLPDWKSNPLVLGGVFCFSMLASVALLLVDFEGTKSRASSNAETRQQLQEFYEVRPGTSPEPWQHELRLAQQAHSRGDHRAERQHYRNVIGFLRSEDYNEFIGITGNRERDAELETHLKELLRER